jgi:replicative DNA helicase
MSQTIPAHMAKSLALQYVVSKGWSWKDASNGQFQVENCVYCKKDNYHFYVAWEGNKDGLFFCHNCGKTGNLRTLQEDQGDRIANVDSRSEWAKGEKKIDPLPDPDQCHAALLGDAEALDYLLNVRGFSEEVIARQKLGIKDKVYFRETGEVKALVIPYLVNGNIIWAKYRTLPPSPKDFTSPKGWDAPLYNGEILVEGLHEVIFVEGEADALCLMSQGINNVVGVPGANTQKTVWIEQLDKVAPDKIYILYDSDKVGLKAAQNLASRIGYDKCLRLVLPEFSAPNPKCEKCAGTGYVDDGCEHDPGTVRCNCWRAGKDVNEWFRWGGGSREVFKELKQHAQLFDVTGVARSGDALDQLEADLEGKASLSPTYATPWEPLNRLLGWENGDVIDIVAPEKIGKTTFGMNVMEFEVNRYNEPGLIICLEMTQARLARKWVCHVTNTDDSLPKTDQEAVARLEKLKEAIKLARKHAANRDADLYFAYPQQVKEPEDVYKMMRDCIRRYGVKWIMFDNVQLLCDTTLKKADHRTIHLSQISKAMAKLAKDYQIKLIRILQPKRISEGRIISTDDVDGSSQIEKDCDSAITLHRSRVGEIKEDDWEAAGYFESDTSFDPKMLVTVGLSRYSCGGSVTLEFDGGASTVREYSMANRTKMNADKPAPRDGNAIPTEVVIPPTQAAPKQSEPPKEEITTI